MDIGQPEIPSCVAVGELLVINPQLVENGSVEIVEMNPIFCSVVSILVCRTILDTWFDPTSGEEHRVGVGIMIPSVTPLSYRSPAKFASP